MVGDTAAGLAGISPWCSESPSTYRFPIHTQSKAGLQSVCKPVARALAKAFRAFPHYGGVLYLVSIINVDGWVEAVAQIANDTPLP